MPYVIQPVPDTEIQWHSGPPDHPLVTLVDPDGNGGAGSRAQIVMDNSCYVLLLERTDGLYSPTHYWFRAAIEAIRALPC